MMLDYTSLLLALGVSATCLALTLAGSWLARRVETFLLTCAIGLLIIIAGIFTYALYFSSPSKWLGAGTISLFLFGFATVWAAASQFRSNRFAFSLPCRWALLSTLLGVTPMVAGYDGLAWILVNAAITLFLCATAREYWLVRSEAYAPLWGISGLYALTAASFSLCAAHLVWDGNMVLGHAPANWAEDLSLAVSIASMTGIGALSLALHQWRLAARHRLDAATDPLTGLLNRRALFDRYGSGRLDPATAVLIFDIDHFKAINDTFGHAGGDEVLRVFAAKLLKHCAARDSAARLGGEEFALVLSNIMPGRAERVAEAIRDSLEKREIMIDGTGLRCTVSVGVATPTGTTGDLDAVLSAADKALYAAKRSGRNRVISANHLQAVEELAACSAS